MRHDMKRSGAAVLIAAVFSLAAALTAFAAEEDTFVPGTTINSLPVSGMTVEEARDHIQSFYSSDYKLVLKEKNNKEETINGADIGYVVNVPLDGLQTVLDTENAEGRTSGPEIDRKYRVELQNSYDQDALDARVMALNCISGSGIVTTADATVTPYREGEPFEIIPEVDGNNMDVEKTLETIRWAVQTGVTEMDLVEAGCYYTVNVTADSPELKDLCDTMNRCREMTVTYIIGDAQEVLDPGSICSWLLGTEDGQIQVDTDAAGIFVQALAAKYDTVGTTRNFTAANGQAAAVSGGNYGWKISVSGELAALVDNIRAGQSVEREPVYSQAAASHASPDWGNTYVEVDLTNQHAYMFQNGAAVWDAPCVTGNTSKGTGTPTGVYSVYSKERDRVLRGELRSDGTYEYESPVSYWMPFNGGVGLHDANWRGSFGGTIYQTNGSHGCVNLPPSQVPALYDMVYVGIPVIVHN